MTAPNSGRWGDLRLRIASAVVMLVLGGTAVWMGGTVMAAMSVVLCGLMVWELAAICAPERHEAAHWIGVAAAAVLFAVLELRSLVPQAMLLLLICPLVAAFWMQRERIIFGLYGFAIMLTGYGFVALREGLGREEGFRMILWVLAIVVVSDISGYFVGRMVGGPKFWPKISPKKTWSGTAAGWVGALVVGLGFVLSGAGWAVLWLSPFIAFAGQMGDIAESWIKRRSGIKDSSNLIPGHGGVLDRLDALIGAVLLLLFAMQFIALPV